MTIRKPLQALALYGGKAANCHAMPYPVHVIGAKRIGVFPRFSKPESSSASKRLVPDDNLQIYRCRLDVGVRVLGAVYSLHQERLALEVEPAMRPGVGIQCVANIDWATGVVLTEGGNQVSCLSLVVGGATRSNAVCSKGGNFLPRFSARRRIPAHAFALKKNFCGIEPFSSTCDNEHTAAALGHSEILGIEDPPRNCSLGAKHTTSVFPFLPWWDELAIFPGKEAKECAKSVVFGREDARDVFPDGDAWSSSSCCSFLINGIGKLHVLDSQKTTVISQPLAGTGNGKRLAWRSADKDVGSHDIPLEDGGSNLGHIAKVGNVRPVVRQHSTREWLNLGKPRRFKSDWFPSQ